MKSPTDKPRSLSTKMSWMALSFALGCACLYFTFELADNASLFDKSKQGTLTGLFPRTVLCGLWAGEALAAVVGLISFLLIRRDDIKSQAITGIVIRSFFSIAIGLVGTLILWLHVGHRVTGF